MRDGKLEEIDGGARLTFERSFAHPVDRVWHAITRPEELAEWLLPFEAEIELDLVEGGSYVMRMADPDSTVFSFTVTRVEPPRLFEHTSMDDGTMRWELEPDGADRCRLVLTQTVSSFARAVENHYASGMHYSLDRLEDALDGKPIDWSWPRWEEIRDEYAARATS
jgi:uncharacterized protein YndB with AHSA1/START domain